ncbi:DEAD/DEAH box helicase family protein [uncultured Photobacterium sp.]|uniref:DEAD/DEAH box helicase family protein n=1 Tax=uncultured Photobacterium sp. TaxID=173973 RepID=UPI002637A3A3|nr:DEAD/DEAH box helicase family protein [uncultured Photobacterium sp.]
MTNTNSTHHTILQNGTTEYVTILSNKNIVISGISNSNRVAAPNDDKQSIIDVINYYAQARIRINQVVIDSDNFSADAVRAIIATFYNGRYSIYDVATGFEITANEGKVAFFSKAYSIINAKQLIESACKEAIRQMPLVYSSYKNVIEELAKLGLPLAQTSKLVKKYAKQHSHQVEKFARINVEHNYDNLTNLCELDLDTIADSNKTFAIKAATGTGKTSMIFGPLAKLGQRKGKKIAYISHLIALVNQFCREYDCTSYRDPLESIEAAQGLGVVINSVYKLHLLDYLRSCDILIIDEFEKVLNAIVCSESNLMNTDVVLDALIEIFTSAKCVVVGDADLTEISLSFLRNVRGDINVIDCIENPYLNIEAIITNQDFHLSRSKEVLRSNLFKDRVYLFDSVSKLKHFVVSAGWINSANLDCENSALQDGVLVIHGANKDMPAQKAFLRNPNDEVMKYRAIVASPCLGSGFSITRDYTNRVTIFCNKTFIPTDLVNFSRRFRTSRQIVFSISANDCTLPIRQFAKPLLQSKNIAHKLKQEFLNRRELLNHKLGISLILTLQNLGFNTRVEIQAPSQLGSAKFACKKTTSEQFIAIKKSILEAEDINKEKEQALLKSCMRTSIDEAAIKKRTIKRTFRLEELDSKAVDYYYIFNNKNLTKNMFLSFCHNADLTHLSINDDKQLEIKASSLLHSILLDNFDFSNGDSMFLEHHTLLTRAQKLLKHAGLLNCHLHQGKLVKFVDTHEKATRLITPLLKSLGFTVGRFGGSKKARVALHPLAKKFLGVG